MTAASATIGPIIPPSVPLLFYGVMADVSIGRLFLGGFVPGLLMAGALMVMIVGMSRRRGYPRHPAPTFRVFAAKTRRAFLSLMTPVILFGGMLSGVFTPTEAAFVAAVWDWPAFFHGPGAVGAARPARSAREAGRTALGSGAGWPSRSATTSSSWEGRSAGPLPPSSSAASVPSFAC